MTQITTIFGALATMAPEWSSDVAIKVWNGSTAGVIKATLPSASVPIRILTTTGDIEAETLPSSPWESYRRLPGS